MDFSIPRLNTVTRVADDLQFRSGWRGDRAFRFRDLRLVHPGLAYNPGDHESGWVGSTLNVWFDADLPEAEQRLQIARLIGRGLLHERQPPATRWPGLPIGGEPGLCAVREEFFAHSLLMPSWAVRRQAHPASVSPDADPALVTDEIDRLAELFCVPVGMARTTFAVASAFAGNLPLVNQVNAIVSWADAIHTALGWSGHGYLELEEVAAGITGAKLELADDTPHWPEWQNGMLYIRLAGRESDPDVRADAAQQIGHALLHASRDITLPALVGVHRLPTTDPVLRAQQADMFGMQLLLPVTAMAAEIELDALHPDAAPEAVEDEILNMCNLFRVPRRYVEMQMNVARAFARMWILGYFQSEN